MAISKKIRFEIFKRDGFICKYCGKTPPDVILEIDHIIPIAEGGTDDLNNLITACFDCNRGKTNISLERLPPNLTENLKVIKEQRKQLNLYNQYLSEIALQKEEDLKEIGHHFFNYFAKSSRSMNKYIFANNWKTSVKLFLKNFNKYQIIEAIDIAVIRLKNKRNLNETSAFKYMCGILHNWKREGNAPNQIP